MSGSETFISYVSGCVELSRGWNVELGKVSDCENIDNLDEKFQRLHGTIYEKGAAAAVVFFFVQYYEGV